MQTVVIDMASKGERERVVNGEISAVNRDEHSEELGERVDM